jgi:hypothetical protein
MLARQVFLLPESFCQPLNSFISFHILLFFSILLFLFTFLISHLQTILLVAYSTSSFY